MPTTGGKRMRHGGRRRRPKKQSTVALVNRVISTRAEKKYFDYYNSTNLPSFSGVCQSLMDIPNGFSDITRGGDSLYMRSLRVRGNLVIADTSNVIRVIIFQWKMDDNVDAATPGDVLSGNGVGTIMAPYAAYNHDGRKRQRVLWDKVFTLDSGRQAISFDTGYLYPTTKKVQYNAAGITGSNKLYILTISDSGAVTHPTANYASRVTFNDM